MLQRISKELAVKLKEKGFNYPCDMMYHNDELSGTKLGMDDKPNDYEGFYAAYLLDEVVKILRDKYDIYVECMSCYKDIGVRYDIDVYIKNASVYYDYNYKTFEKAQEAGINKAIELI